MKDSFEKGIAFILEGDTEKVFYLSLLEHLCEKYNGISLTKKQIIVMVKSSIHWEILNIVC